MISRRKVLAAAAARIPAIMSGSSLIPMEEVRAANPGAWFQAYLPGEPDRILALGAKFVFVGRPFNYAGAVGGEAGIAHAIGILATEMARNMALLGVLQPSDLGSHHLRRRGR